LSALFSFKINKKTELKRKRTKVCKCLVDNLHEGDEARWQLAGTHESIKGYLPWQ
jgi:hypothetical protein